MLEELAFTSDRLRETHRFQVIQAADEELKDLVYRFRYHVYVRLMNRRQVHADHARGTIVEPMDEMGSNYLAVKDGRVIGTIRRNVFSDASTRYYAKIYRVAAFEGLDVDRIAITTKLMMLPNYQRSTLPVRLITEYARDGYRQGIAVDMIDCNKHLIEFFEKMGYFSYIGWAFHKEFGSVRPMFLASDAVQYLTAINSFLTQSAHGLVSDGAYGGYERIRRLAQEPKHPRIRELSRHLRHTVQ